MYLVPGIIPSDLSSAGEMLTFPPVPHCMVMDAIYSLNSLIFLLVLQILYNSKITADIILNNQHTITSMRN